MGSKDKMKKKAKTRKPYATPTLTKLTPEQARLKLVPDANKGNEGAKELLKSLPAKVFKDKKKSA
jgi:hypothetical protein